MKPDLGQTLTPRAIAICLPTEYTAFCQLYQTVYHHYAMQRINDVATARNCVEKALGELVTIWPAVLSSEQPAAVAWKVLRAWVNRAAPERGSRPLTADQADALLLRTQLQFPMAKIASVMGLEQAAIEAYLRSAARLFQACPQLKGLDQANSPHQSTGSWPKPAHPPG
ncbi:hypothetical protein ACFPM3_30640 [Streptomyces coeruleoprunus]|uniref:Uncharacterized protein n=1 Tax=Streptomyces coeruleoprunus TaxID=285563 RepID=A0ABV9XSQ4_9ACTN